MEPSIFSFEINKIADFTSKIQANWLFLALTTKRSLKLENLYFKGDN